MAIRHLPSLSRRSATRSLRSLSNALVVATATASKPLPSPLPPDAMTYNSLALSVNQNLKLLHNPDPRFFTHNFPHPTPADHTPILSSPLTRITILPSGLRIATESDLASKTATVEGQTKEVIFDHLHATAFQYTPLGRTILGPAQNIKTITKEDLKNYISTHYTASRMVNAASGAVKHEDIVEQVKKLFTKLSTDPTVASELVAKEPAIFTGFEVRIVDDNMPLTQFAVAFNGASWTDPDSIALMVVQSMLGSWNKNAGGGKYMGSELAQRVGINEIAESMMAFNTNYKDTGLFGVYAIAKPDCLDDLAYAIMYEISKLSYRVSEADVTRARNQVATSSCAYR
ncbi:hypothetical protein RHMOL_Rhmol07G0272700 [Rhododendron molle]|uniref:Uncharacterized protein n=1 Tax=Rhododendron molle TaxID=49168 RepID=A0ACC0N7A7_RHOML|nr:hypothetical protein RHMOL_Rhmol07G0272700 [Rhododendron molle]